MGLLSVTATAKMVLEIISLSRPAKGSQWNSPTPPAADPEIPPQEIPAISNFRRTALDQRHVLFSHLNADLVSGQGPHNRRSSLGIEHHLTRFQRRGLNLGLNLDLHRFLDQG